MRQSPSCICNKRRHRLSIAVPALVLIVYIFLSYCFRTCPIPRLTWSHNKATALSLNNPSTHTKPRRTLIYITTHLSSQHYAFLEGCWPALLSSLPLFQEADFAMFVAASERGEKKIDTDLIRSVFARTGITIHTVPNPGYQQGAIAAMVEGFGNGWFAGYDWVVRLNPDVLIKDDAFLLATMANDAVDGIFVDCFDRPCPAGKHCSNRLMHTDFFAVRPAAVPPDAFLKADDTLDAEKMVTRAFAGIVSRGADAWLPDTGPHGNACRVRGERSPVVHDHANVWTCAGKKTEVGGRDGVAR